MVRHLGDGFRFVATEPIPQDRLDMGYKNLENAPYALNAYKSDEAYSEAMRLASESDVVILGSAPQTFIEKRLADNKLTFTTNHFSTYAIQIPQETPDMMKLIQENWILIAILLFAVIGMALSYRFG